MSLPVDAPAGDALGILSRFRVEFHECLYARADALFELTDAVLCADGPVKTLVELSLAVEHRRGHGALYAALDRGWLEPTRLRRTLAGLPLPKAADGRIVLAVDVSNWLRPDAPTSDDRLFCHVYGRGDRKTDQFVPGWPYSFVAALESGRTSWVALLDAVRLGPADDATLVTAAQLRDVVERLTQAGHWRPGDLEILIVMDAGYDVTYLSHALADLPVVLVGRLRSDRVMLRDAGPTRSGPKGGRPRRHGGVLTFAKPDSWHQPDVTTSTDTTRYGKAEAMAWDRMHPRLTHRGPWLDHAEEELPVLHGTLVRLQVERLPGDRDPKPVWLWCSATAATPVDVDRWWQSFLRRFDLEHTFRLLKQTLGWTAPKVRHADSADLWTWLIIAAHTQLRLARPLAEDLRRPWERPAEPRRLTPARVRRGFATSARRGEAVAQLPPAGSQERFAVRFRRGPQASESGMMGRNFLVCDRERVLEMPRSQREWLPPEHLCWKVLDVVGELDLSAFEGSYRSDGQGGAAHPPASLIALILYCYGKGVRSSRRIEQACWDDVGCRIITANRRVDHSTIARFIRRHRAALSSLFVQVLALCGRSGLVDLSAVAVDGSPMEANASRDSNQRLERLEAIIIGCEGEINELMDDVLSHARIVEADGPAATDSGHAADDWPRLSRLCDRLTRARSAKDRIHERAMPSPSEVRIKVEAATRMVDRAEKRLAAETAAHQERLRKHEARARADLAAGRRGANGRPPASMENKTVLVRQRARVVEAQARLERARHPLPMPSAKSRACLSDPDSRLMPGKHGGYLQGYNVQIACARRQVLLAIEVHDNPSDMTALVPMVKKTQRNHQAAGLPGDIELWLADSGYASTASFEALADLPLLVSVTSEADQAGFPAKRQQPRASHHEMAARLASPTGRSQYRQRSALVEPGFAQLFQRFGRHLNYRGRHAVDTELKLLGAVHNLHKLLSHTARMRS